MAYDLKYYSDVFATIDSIYRQELNRPADMGGLINWFYHVRENGHDGDWLRARIRESAEWHAIHDKPQPQSLPRLAPTGAVFRLETGERFTAIECSDFNLFGRYLVEGEDVVREVLKERAALGFNLLRVWLAYGPGTPAFAAEVGRLVPSEHPEMYGRIPEFARLASAYGLYLELTAFTGGPIQGHWEQIGAALQGVTNAIVELTNENNAHPGIDPRAYQPIPGVVCSHGSNGSQAAPVRPPWQYEVFHTNDAFEWWRKGGHNGMEFSAGDAEGQIVPSHVPVIANENTRPDRDGNLNHFYDAAAGAALLIAGSCFHSASGKKSALFGDADRAFAEAHVRGAQSVDLACQEGAYRHAAELEGPNDLRVYQKVYSDGRRYTVTIRK